MEKLKKILTRTMSQKLKKTAPVNSQGTLTMTEKIKTFEIKK